MKKRSLHILAVLLLIAGICFLSYPFIGNIINQCIQKETIGEYDRFIAQMEKETLEQEREAARQYNAGLADEMRITASFIPHIKRAGEYEKRLNLKKDGVMGYIEIPEIDVKLAIYHGTGDRVLKKGAGHLESTSLPVGGKGTHAVLTAHTAHPSTVFFDNLKKLNKGSIFILTVLDEKLAYEVDQIKVVEPHVTDDLRIKRGKDYVTLVTCTPYGVNTHRLLVRGHRVPNEDANVNNTMCVCSCCPYILIALIILIIINIIQLIIILKRRCNYPRKNDSSINL